VLVDAAGAWADGFAVLAGAAPLGLVPHRRTACLVDPGRDAAGWPLLNDVPETFYCKPESGAPVAARDLLVSLRKRPKQALDLGSGKPDPAVGHREDKAHAPTREALHGDVKCDAAAIGELHRIVDEVLKRTTQPQRIADHAVGKVSRDVDLGSEVLGAGTRRQRSRERVGERTGTEGHAAERQAFGLGSHRVDDERSQHGEMIGGAFEQFVAAHRRQALPDVITWESGAADVPARAHWLVIDRLAERQNGEPRFADVNALPEAAAPDFGIRASGTTITRVLKGSNAEQLGLRDGDVVAAINNQQVGEGSDVADALRSFPSGRPLLLNVVRGGEPVRLTGRYAPGIVGDGLMFSRSHASGRVDLKRTGNRVEVRCSGVAAFSLLLSPDQFDLNRSVAVVVNGRTVIDGVVKKDLRTLLTWAARDNDRTMLFEAAVNVTVAR